MPQPRRPQIFNTSDGAQGLVFRITLHYRDKQGQFVLIPIPAQDHLESLEIEEGSGPYWKGTVTLFDTFGGMVESLLIAAGAVQYISIRWGWADGPGLDTYPEYIGQVLRINMEFASEGMRFSLDLANAAAVHDLMMTKVRSWPKDKLVCHRTRKDNDGSLPIVQAIATDEKNKWSTAGTVEDMDLRMTKEFQANGESDARILEAVAAEVRGANGKEVLAYIDTNGNCHFRSQSEKPTGAIIPRYRVLRDNFGDVIRFTPSDQTLLMMLQGAGDALYAAADGLTGDVLQIESTVIDGPSGSPIQVHSDSAYVRATDPMRKRLIYLAEADPEAFRRRVSTMYDVLRSRMLVASLEVRGTHCMRIMGEAAVDVLLPDGLLHYTSGVYFLRKLRHSVGSGGWTTSVEGTKYGVRPIKEGQKVANTLPIDQKIIEDARGGNKPAQAHIRAVNAVFDTNIQPGGSA
jgi:hypothetical protein